VKNQRFSKIPKMQQKSKNHQITFKKMCRVAARRLSIYNFAWGLLQATKSETKVKQTKINMESIRRSLQAQPNNTKKLAKHQINQSK
jgi:hypothetical protein